MKLGNSGGKNKGKKYLKLKGNEIITEENQLKADVFSEWFGRNYQQLKKELIYKNTLNEDTLNDTFLRIYDKIAFGGLVVNDYKSYFHRSFYTNFMQSVINEQKERQTVESINENDDILDHENSGLSNSDLRDQILAYARQKYDKEKYLLLLLYFKLGSDKSVSVFTDLPYNNIAYQLHSIRQDLRKNYRLELS